MTFFSSPSEETELLHDMQCEVFQDNSKVVVHFFIEAELSLRVNKSTDETSNQLYIERIDTNQQFFDLQFNRNLSFLELSDVQLFLFEQHP